MTTEYRDGTAEDLEPGDGFSYKGLGATNWETEPSHEYVGKNCCVHVQYRHLSSPSQVPISDAYNLRIWPDYFKDKEPASQMTASQTVWVEAIAADEHNVYIELANGNPEPLECAPKHVSTTPPQPDFDLEAFRARLEEMFAEAQHSFVRQTLDKVFDLLPPKPKPEGIRFRCQRTGCGAEVVMPYTDESRKYVDWRPAEGWGFPGSLCPEHARSETTEGV